MKAYELQEATTDYSGLARVEHERPAPAADEVLVRMHAYALKAHDLGLANSERAFGPGPDFPVVPVSDGAGEVVEVGEEVERLAVGDRVATRYAPNWIEGEGSFEKWVPFMGIADGVLAEYVTLPAESLPVLPDHLTYEEAATLPTVGVAAWHAIVENGDVHADDAVLVLGTGGLSSFSLQFATMHGAKTIVTSHSDAKLEQAAELGAWRTINHEENPEWGEDVAEMTGGGVDQVLEVGGVGTLPESLEAAAPNGHVHAVGVADSSRPRDYGVHMGIYQHILHKALHVEGIWGAGSLAMFERMNRAIDATELRPVIDQVFGFDDVVAAYRRLDSGEHQGRVVIEAP